MIKKYLYIIAAIFCLTSCISNKDLTYFQGKSKASTIVKRVDNTPYRLQVGDMLNIRINSNNEKAVDAFQKNGNSGNLAGGQLNNQPYFLDYSIDSYGNIRIPTLGEINVLGYTTSDVRKKIENKLRKDFLKNDESLFVDVKLSGIRYTIIGEINSPGTRIILQNRLSIVDVIAESGGITDLGNRKAVEIYRKTPNGVEKFSLDLTDIDVLTSSNFFIKSNDIININPLKQKSWGTGTTALQSLSSAVSVLTLITTTLILARNL
ncbi:polysaccharide biosynthesis/export family protein [Polaribacter tangerinus]|uniref:polysaccharide biosynthesis/export family protein n=1 Tax=Polaribacter tangerinus TaxID=1920034 RepID=UPI000B4B6304|nr:polysaccharide biosynthesis/export family protein [Polaribacter tangerinus]